jgi:hypothetical protein
MKKIIPFFAFLLIATMAIGQLNFTNNTNIGLTHNNLNNKDKDTLLLHFNTALASASWTYNESTSTYTITSRKAQTQRGMQVNVYGDAVATGNGITNPDFECRDYGGNRNPQHVQSLDSLLSVLRAFELQATTQNARNKPAACLFDVAGDAANQAFGAYPAHYKRVEYGYRLNFSGKAINEDVSIEVETYAAGNTGKTATYKLEVYKSSVSEANKLGEVANIYVTGDPKKTVNIAQAINVSPSVFTNQSIFVFFKTMGTTNAEGVADAVPNAEGVMDPIIVFDNLNIYYGSPRWDVPAGVVGNAVINHNSGDAVVTVSTDWSGGTPVPVAAGLSRPVKVKLSSVDRVGTIAITEANDGGGHAAAYSFEETGAIKKKSGSGMYDVDVAYTRTINEISGVYTLTVAAPTSGSVSDDMEVTLMANVPLAATRTIRLELNNGVRFWYNVSAIGMEDVNTAVDQTSAAKFAFVQGRSIVSEAGALQIFNVNGQLVKSVNAAAANAGVIVEPGIYVVKLGAEVQKVVVR